MNGDPTCEGWFTGPYRVHEARWMSEGHPSKLVRDGEVPLAYFTANGFKGDPTALTTGSGMAAKKNS